MKSKQKESVWITLSVLILACTNFCELKNFVFREYLFSRIVINEKFGVYLFSRIRLIEKFVVYLFSRKYVTLKNFVGRFAIKMS